MDLLSVVASAWGWSGLKPLRVVGDNEFGNLIVEDESGQFWRITPEDLACKVIARDRAALDALSVDQQFLHDWYAKALVEKAKDHLGPLAPGYRYCLKVPAVLSGAYEVENFGVTSMRELIASSGHIASEISDLPDGSQVRLVAR